MLALKCHHRMYHFKEAHAEALGLIIPRDLCVSGNVVPASF